MPQFVFAVATLKFMHAAEYLQNSQAAALIMHNVGSKVQKRLLIPQQ